MSRTLPFTVSDRFAGVDRPDEVFVVTGLGDKPGLPPLAGRQLGGSGGPTLLGVSALLDRSLRVPS